MPGLTHAQVSLMSLHALRQCTVWNVLLLIGQLAVNLLGKQRVMKVTEEKQVQTETWSPADISTEMGKAMQSHPKCAIASGLLGAG